MATVMSAVGLAGYLATASGTDDLGDGGGGAVVVTGSFDALQDVTLPPLLPKVVIAAGASGASVGPPVFDVVVGPADLDAVVEVVDANPQAAAALAVLVRASLDRPVAEGLLAESAVYGVLQGGSEFARWRGSRAVRTRPSSPGHVVRVERRDDVLHVELNRPEVHNALDAELRDELASALLVALDDPGLSVELAGAGPSYSSGGDLDEFGSRSDPAAAHLIRLSRNLGWLLHRLRDRVHVTVHGPTAGSGVELPAFAGRVTARPGTTFSLPEVGLGLVPGAGGTVSIPRRVGRQRTMLLALLGRPIDAPTALAWGLVDEVAGP